jgi:F-type H+/Na+-transporting ATPase subunit alpha
MDDVRFSKNMTIAEEILERIKSCEEEILQEEVGIVLDSGDGIARIAGLPGAMLGEMLDFGEGVFGIIFNLESEEVVAIILDSHVKVHEGGSVRRTKRIMEIPVGDALLGRVITPTGKPVDGMEEIVCHNYRAVENVPPGVIDRDPVSKPLQTGYMVVDATVPIGHGQRELIIGDRQTGKTTLAIDTILNQKGKGVVCIYVAIGQKNSSVARIVQLLKAQGALEYTIIVNSSASSPPALQFIAPYSGCAIAEEYMSKGRQVLIVYDDLTKHAHAYRNISLLLKRPPGREAFPGDIFYVHSKLLERSAQLSQENGGGSMTALPIVETQNSDISSYIPTNLVSITDGQIFLSTELFNANIRPSVNPGISVSRVGGSAQLKLMKQISGLLRLTLAQFREKEKFSMFASDLDDDTVKQLTRGRVLTEILKQSPSQPIVVSDQIVMLYIAVNGFLDAYPVELVRRKLTEVIIVMKSNGADLLDAIKLKNEIVDEETFKKLIEDSFFQLDQGVA